VPHVFEPMSESDHSLPTIAALLRARVGDTHPGYVFDDVVFSWNDVVVESVRRSALIARLDELGTQPEEPGLGREIGRRAHIGVLLENCPEYLFWAGGAAFVGAAIVGINPTRRGDELARDVRHTDCRWIITDSSQAHLFDGLDLGGAGIVLIDSPEYHDALASLGEVPVPAVADDPSPSTTLFLLFTSGSTSAPKAVVCSTGRMAGAGVRASAIYGVTRDEVCYCSMPMFHGNALMACWAPALAHGATVVIRRKFSASQWLTDVRKYGITYFTYVGRTIAYVLGQPPSSVDRDHHLRLGFGTEASALDRQRFAERFGCELVESYGSSESVISIMRTPDAPPGALGVPRDPAVDVIVADPVTGNECPRAEFDEHGGLVNGHVAIGELVNRTGGGAFEGYYANAEATTGRMRNGWYWSGDLAYRDADGWFYFAGRDADMLRVDSENFAAAPIENIISRFAGVVMVAVYPVPDPRTGDQVMAAIEMAPDVPFSADAFAVFLGEQRDLGTKWAPKLVRLVTSMPLTANNKVHKPPLRAEKWHTSDPVFTRPGREVFYAPMTATDVEALTKEFAHYARTALA
jgi:fatty-acyl-CoA synthase